MHQPNVLKEPGNGITKQDQFQWCGDAYVHRDHSGKECRDKTFDDECQKQEDGIEIDCL